MDRFTDKALGSMVGGAAGDALGYAVEFMAYPYIIDRYGMPGITEFDTCTDGLALISDDTQMTLFTAEGLINYGNIDGIRQAYAEWFYTQYGEPGGMASPTCRLTAMPEMYSRRAPGGTCLSALANIVGGRPVDNDSKGCGGIMRIAPVPIYAVAHHLDRSWAFRMACDVAGLTHRHPLGWLSAGIMASLIYDALVADRYDVSVLRTSCQDALEETERMECADNEWLDELRRGLDLALCLAESDRQDVEAIRTLGEGWVGEEALYIAVYCTARHIDDFKAALIASVNHSGDSDSTGAITGNLLGAILGYNDIPAIYKDGLELRTTIEDITRELIS